MKLYTRTGDDGSTGLFGGGRVQKDHPRVEAYGNVDELNACIGWVRAIPAPAAGPVAGTPFFKRLSEILAQLQSRLFDLGADLATPPDSKHEDKVKRMTAAHVVEAEGWIDEVDAENSPIEVFILPGGTELAARLHIARTVCRRAERSMVHLAEAESVNPHTITYVNRISDMLFAMARRANKEAGVADVAWQSASR